MKSITIIREGKESHQSKLEEKIKKIEITCGNYKDQTNQTACFCYNGYYDLKKELEVILEAKKVAELRREAQIEIDKIPNTKVIQQVLAEDEYRGDYR